MAADDGNVLGIVAVVVIINKNNGCTDGTDGRGRRASGRMDGGTPSSSRSSLLCSSPTEAYWSDPSSPIGRDPEAY